jgi:hypothetical protein
VYRLIANLARLRRDEGMSTVEYAVGTLAAAALGGVLYKVLTNPAVQAALTAVIERALK